MRTPTGMAKPAVPPGALIAQPSEAALCERAVLAIWQHLDAHDLVDEAVREQLAGLLDPLVALPLDGRPQRLLKALRMPDPINASQLYWLTRRLLTLVPELQALCHAGTGAGQQPPLAH